MSTLASRLGEIIPEGNIKHTLRLGAFKILFLPGGTRNIKLGPSWDPVPARVVRLPLAPETLGQSEIEGYLQHYRPKSGDIIVNAGAYHGYFALYLSQIVGPTGRVICLEPEPNNLKILRRNIKLNQRENITVVPHAIWHENTNLPLISRGSGSSVLPETNWRLQTVRAQTLDSILSNLGVNKVNLITMDIEGAELQAIKGCQKTIDQNPGLNFAIASYHRISGFPTFPSVERFFRHLGFQVETSYPNHLTTYVRRQLFNR